MKEQLAKIRSEALAAFGQAQSAAELTACASSIWARRVSSPPF